MYRKFMKVVYGHPDPSIRQEMVQMIKSDPFSMDITDQYGTAYAQRKLDEIEQMIDMIK